MAKNNTLARRISVYPSLFYFKITVALAFDKDKYKSEIAEYALKKYIDTMNPSEHKRFLDMYDNMTEEQKRNKKKND